MNFFIIGIRRSRTSLLKRLIEQSPDKPKIVFEPHDLYYAVAMSPMSRYRDYYQQKKDQYAYYDGVKFALNPGVCALEWKLLPECYPEAKFVFIIRDTEEIWESYKKEDQNSYRGVLNREAYVQAASQLQYEFVDFYNRYKERGKLLFDDSLIVLPNETMKQVWRFLNLTPGEDISKMIKS